VNRLVIIQNIFTKVLVSEKRVKRKPLFFYVLLISTLSLVMVNSSYAQGEAGKNQPDNPKENTSKDTIIPHSPKKAAVYSAALPGLGQAYNNKYWKIPIIYAGFGTLVYFIDDNNTKYNKFKAAYSYVISGEEGNPPNEYVERYESNSEHLRKLKDFYRRNLEVSYLLTGALYILNILDATVDAHFFNFNIDKDLSLKVSPYIRPAGTNTIFADKGISITLNL